MTVTDTLPSGVTFDSATPSQGTCSQASGTVTCTLGTINNGGNATVSIKVTPQAQGPITNQASVASDAIGRQPGEQLGERDDHGEPGRRPRRDQVATPRTRRWWASS